MEKESLNEEFKDKEKVIESLESISMTLVSTTPQDLADPGRQYSSNEGV
jgi:hypothetical protein